MKRRYINLLSWRFRLGLIVRTRLLQWLVMVSVVCLSALAFWQIKSQDCNAASDAVALMESRCKPLEATRIENQQMTKRLAELNSHQSLLTRLDDEQVSYRLIGLVSHGVKACSGGLRVNTLVVDRKQEPLSPSRGQQTAQPIAEPTTPQYREITILKLHGVADDNLAISRFVAALRDSGVFATVDLRSSVGARVDEGRAQSFLVECTLVNGPRAAFPQQPVFVSRF